MTKSMDKLLREALRARLGAVPQTPCLDAAIVGALAEGTLPARERSGAEAHVADCARCQAVLAAVVRTMPPTVPRAWWRRPAYVWLAPLTAAAAALVIWTAVPRREIPAPALRLDRESALAVDAGAARPARPSPAAELQSQREAVPPAPPPSAAASAQQRRDRVANRQDRPETAQQKAFADNAVAPRAAPPPPAAADARIGGAQLPSTPLPQAAVPAPQPSPQTEREASRTAPTEQAPQPAAAGTMAVTSDSAGQTMMRRFEARESTIVSATSIGRWRLGSGGVVYHSTDGGATWQAQATGMNVTLVAGSTPSPSVCWLVGPAGVVLVTTDEGRSWQRLSFPTPIDLRSVRATNDKTATVIAADGRAFSTSDGGRTWRP